MEGTSLLGAKHESYLQLWRGRVMECRNSGKTIAVWCKENGINIKTYYFWQKRVWDKETQTQIQSGQNQLPQAQAVQFAQVNLGMETSSDADTLGKEIIKRMDRITTSYSRNRNYENKPFKRKTRKSGIF